MLSVRLGKISVKIDRRYPHFLIEWRAGSRNFRVFPSGLPVGCKHKRLLFPRGLRLSKPTSRCWNADWNEHRSINETGTQLIETSADLLFSLHRRDPTPITWNCCCFLYNGSDRAKNGCSSILNFCSQGTHPKFASPACLCTEGRFSGAFSRRRSFSDDGIGWCVQFPGPRRRGPGCHYTCQGHA
jgi:hypothetical protein